MRRIIRKIDFKVIDFDQNWWIAVISTLVCSNLIINVFIIEQYLSPDGNLVPSSKRLIYGYNFASLAAAGGLVLFFPKLARFRFAIKLHHAIAGFVLLEGFLRLTIFTDYVNISAIENPRLYASGDCDNDGYHVLSHYHGGVVSPRGDVDPLLGWVRGSGEMRIVTDKYLSRADVKKRPLLFFGDSFVAWGRAMEDKIPQIMGELLPQFDVLNFGVPGYGTDQIVLRFQHEFVNFAKERPIVLTGILLQDIDRALLKYRGAQKPYFQIEEGRLVLHKPRYATNKEFVDAFHFHDKSFVLSMLAAPIKKAIDPAHWCGKERYELNYRIIQEMLKFARTYRADVHVVIFYSHNDLLRVSAREKELKEIFSHLGFSQVIDTKKLLLRYLETTGGQQLELYDEGGSGHHTAVANRVIAKGIADYLRSVRADI